MSPWGDYTPPASVFSPETALIWLHEMHDGYVEAAVDQATSEAAVALVACADVVAGTIIPAVQSSEYGTPGDAAAMVSWLDGVIGGVRDRLLDAIRSRSADLDGLSASYTLLVKRVRPAFLSASFPRRTLG